MLYSMLVFPIIFVGVLLPAGGLPKKCAIAPSQADSASYNTKYKYN